jgi:MFS family permease
MIGATAGSFLTGRLITRLKHYMRIPIFGMAVAVALLVFLSIHPAGFSVLTFTLLFAVLGAAIGPMYQTSTIVMQNAVKPHQMGTATGALNFFRLLGGAIIVAVFGAMVFGGGGRTAGLAVSTLAAGHTDFVQAFRLVFIAGAVFVAITLVCLMVVEEVPLHGPVRRAAPAE